MRKKKLTYAQTTGRLGRIPLLSLAPDVLKVLMVLKLPGMLFSCFILVVGAVVVDIVVVAVVVVDVVLAVTCVTCSDPYLEH